MLYFSVLGCPAPPLILTRKLTSLKLSKGQNHMLKIEINGSGDLIILLPSCGGLRFSFLLCKWETMHPSTLLLHLIHFKLKEFKGDMNTHKLGVKNSTLALSHSFPM